MSINSVFAPCAQPIATAFSAIMLRCITNADTPEAQKEFIMIARENGIISDADAQNLISAYGLTNA